MLEVINHDPAARSSRKSRCHATGSVMSRYGLSFRISSSAAARLAIIYGEEVSFPRFGFSSTDSTVIRTCARPGFSHAGRGESNLTLPSAPISMSVSNVFIRPRLPTLK